MTTRYGEMNRCSRMRCALAAVLAALAGIVIICAAAVQSFAAPELIPVGDPDAEAPSISAKGAAVYSVDLDRVVYEKNGDERIDPYSITKIFTCWMALENLDPDSYVTVSEDAAQTYANGTSIWLKPGEQITVRDLIYGAMLESGNDAAYALGEAVAGSEKAFGRMMTEQAAEWGCTGTNFVNANGWQNKDHYTTARDMSIIASKCFANEELMEISCAKNYVIPTTNKSEARKLQNYFRYTIGKTDDKNIPDAIESDAKWMDKDDARAVTGGKTGSWDSDDCSIVVCFSRKGLTGIVVLLGDNKKDRPRDAARLMDFAHEVTPGFLVSAKDDIVDEVWVRHGARTRTELCVHKDTIAYPQSEDPDDIRIEMETDKLEAPVRKGDKVGKYRVYVGDKQIAVRGLYASEDIETGWLPSYLYISNRVTARILEVIAALVILLMIVRTINKRRSRRRRARRNREIARRAKM